MIRIFSIVMIMFVLCGCGSPEPDTLVDSGYDQEEMDAAIAHARTEVKDFIAELSNPTGTNHAVKAAIKENGEVEHFWLTGVSFSDGQFTGTINNEPGIVGNVEMGQQWTVKQDEISDWMFMLDGKMHGNYTLRPLLRAMTDQEEAKRLREMLAQPESEKVEASH